MNVRAKFVYSKYETNLDHTGKEIRTMHFHAVSGGSEENKRFFAYSPYGEIKLSCVNPAVWQAFELGKEYYLDFSAATPVANKE